MAVHVSGQIFVSQPMENTVRVFDPDGRSLGRIGRLGEGPGEFRTLSRIGLLGDTLYAADGDSRRVTFFSVDGELLGTTPLIPRELGPEFLPRTPEWLATDGTSLSYTAFNPVLMEPNSSVRFLYVHIDRSGETVDTAALLDLAPQQTIRLRGAVGPLITAQLFSGLSLPVISADGSRLAIVDEGDTRAGPTVHVTALRSTRDTVWSHEYTFEPIPVSAAMVDSAVAEKARGLNPDNFPDPADAERQIREGMAVPDHLAPVSSGVFADDGDLWLRREAVPGQGQRWTVFDSTGTPVGQITLPRNLAVKVVRANTLWGVETDAMGVPYVVRYALTRGASGD